MKRTIATSASHPLLVSWLPLSVAGKVGLTFAPGRKDDSLRSNLTWQRDLDQDLAHLVTEYRTTALVCLIEDHELELLGIAGYFNAAEAHGLEVIRFPIVDVSVPANPLAVRDLVDDLLARATRGDHLVIHCRGGIGRTGTIAGCLLARTGMPHAQIRKTLHAARGPHCPETPQQIRFIERFASELRQ